MKAALWPERLPKATTENKSTQLSTASPPEPQASHAHDLVRARTLLEAAGLGHLRPDRSWRPRSWADRLASLGIPEDELIDQLASEIYAANWREPSPEWKMARDGAKDWSRKQARAALELLRRLERGAAK